MIQIVRDSSQPMHGCVNGVSFLDDKNGWITTTNMEKSSAFILRKTAERVEMSNKSPFPMDINMEMIKHPHSIQIIFKRES